MTCLRMHHGIFLQNKAKKLPKITHLLIQIIHLAYWTHPMGHATSHIYMLARHGHVNVLIWAKYMKFFTDIHVGQAWTCKSINLD